MVPACGRRQQQQRPLSAAEAEGCDRCCKLWYAVVSISFQYSIFMPPSWSESHRFIDFRQLGCCSHRSGLALLNPSSFSSFQQSSMAIKYHQTNDPFSQESSIAEVNSWWESWLPDMEKSILAFVAHDAMRFAAQPGPWRYHQPRNGSAMVPESRPTGAWPLGWSQNTGSENGDHEKVARDWDPFRNDVSDAAMLRWWIEQLFCCNGSFKRSV